MSEVALKKAWPRVKFGDVVKLSRERSSDPEGDGFERNIGLEHMDPGDLKIRRWGDIADGTTFTSVFRTGQILFGKRRAYQRKVAIADFSGVCSGDIYVLEPKHSNLLPELLPFICQTDGFFEHAVGTSAGSLSPRTKWDSLASYEFSLPPLEEQRRIANGLTAHDLYIDALYNAKYAALQVRKSLLMRMFPTTEIVRRSVSLRKLLENGSLLFQTGPFGTVLSAAEYRKGGWPIVNPTHILDGKIVHGDGPCVDDSTARKLTRYRMEVGDILLARKGEIDKACLVTEDQKGWIVGSDCILLRTNPTAIVGSYLLLFLQSPSIGRKLHSFAHGTVMPGLNEEMLARLVIPTRELAEQELEVAVVRQLDSVLSSFNEQIRSVRSVRAESLSQAFMR